LLHRRQAQEAVEDQERKIAQLTALQADLKGKLADMMADVDEDDVEDDYAEDDAEQAAAPASAGDDIAERVLALLAVKTDECQKLAAVVEEARAAGMDPANPRLQVAERNLAERYQEIKELASFAHRLGLTDDASDDDADDDEEIADEQASQAQALVQYRDGKALEVDFTTHPTLLEPLPTMCHAHPIARLAPSRSRMRRSASWSKN
jgi:hypothetical protein